MPDGPDKLTMSNILSATVSTCDVVVVEGKITKGLHQNTPKGVPISGEIYGKCKQFKPQWCHSVGASNGHFLFLCLKEFVGTNEARDNISTSCHVTFSFGVVSVSWYQCIENWACELNAEHGWTCAFKSLKVAVRLEISTPRPISRTLGILWGILNRSKD